MEVGLKPKVNNINIKKIGKQYEINFGDEIWIYLGGRKELAELRDKINDVLVGKDNKSDMLREKQDYIEEVKKAGRFDKDSLLTREEQEWKKTRHKMINRKIN